LRFDGDRENFTALTYVRAIANMTMGEDIDEIIDE
jgi:hypothetical protein